MRDVEAVCERDEIEDGSLSHRALVQLFISRGASPAEAATQVHQHEVSARLQAAERRRIKEEMELRRAIERGIGDA